MNRSITEGSVMDAVTGVFLETFDWFTQREILGIPIIMYLVGCVVLTFALYLLIGRKK